MSVSGFFRNIASSALAKLQTAFPPKAPTPEPASRAAFNAASRTAGFNALGGRFWWRSSVLTPHMRHKMANDKGLMVAENPLLRGLIARSFKEVL